MSKRIIINAGNFHPRQLSGGQLYLRKDQATPSSWVSDIGTARNFAQGTVLQQPTISANSVDFDGVNDVQLVTESNAFASDTIGTIEFSFYWDGLSKMYIFTSSDIATVNFYFALLCSTAGKIILGIRNTLPNTNNVESTQTAVVGFNYGYVTTDGTTTSFSLNGSSQTAGTVASGVSGTWFAFVPSNRDNLAIGAFMRSIQQFSPLKLNKLYYRNVAYTTAERNAMNLFMSNPSNY